MDAPQLSASVQRLPCCFDAAVLRRSEPFGVRFVVAPYEADAQMAYLARNGAVHAVITEDSDLLAYGCPRSAQPSLQHAACTAQHSTAAIWRQA